MDWWGNETVKVANLIVLLGKRVIILLDVQPEQLKTAVGVGKRNIYALFEASKNIWFRNFHSS